MTATEARMDSGCCGSEQTNAAVVQAPEDLCESSCGLSLPLSALKLWTLCPHFVPEGTTGSGFSLQTLVPAHKYWLNKLAGITESVNVYVTTLFFFLVVASLHFYTKSATIGAGLDSRSSIISCESPQVTSVVTVSTFPHTHMYPSVLTVLRLTIGALISCSVGHPPTSQLESSAVTHRNSWVSGSVCMCVCLCAPPRWNDCVYLFVCMCVNMYAFVPIFINLRHYDSIFITACWWASGCDSVSGFYWLDRMRLPAWNCVFVCFFLSIRSTSVLIKIAVEMCVCACVCVSVRRAHLCLIRSAVYKLALVCLYSVCVQGLQGSCLLRERERESSIQLSIFVQASM